MSYSKEDLEGLTEAEIEALKEDDGADDKTTLGDSLNEDGTPKVAAADEGQTETTGKTDDDAAAAAAAAEAAGKTESTNTPAVEAAKVDEKPVVAEPAKPLPLLVAEAPANADADLKAISEKKGTLLEQFDNGDITAKEYQSQLDTLNREERTIERAVEKAQTASEMNQQQEKNSWLGQVNDFTTTAHPEYRTSKSRWMALDTFVKEIAGDPANANLSGGEILSKAHAMVEADLGIATAKKDPAPELDPKTGKPKVDDAAGKPLKGAKINPPQTLAKVPAADQNEQIDNRWAALDRLAETDPEAQEEALFKMSAADRDAYLASR
ncbi:hypothetical protein [Paraburkholderia hospita]|uniref:hypothetical protein n=1 Tax=Paraburkholderia hospita TaxID=169430 RepID=UPI0008A7CFCB|nr:hypothetical protein [Paraburkholderia hospita]SEH89628.1 hypothetical protein SAMN05192544_1011137 [Paraburkholderia hospita]